jgi:hypothetical protein
MIEALGLKRLENLFRADPGDYGMMTPGEKAPRGRARSSEVLRFGIGCGIEFIATSSCSPGFLDIADDSDLLTFLAAEATPAVCPASASAQRNACAR